MRVYPALDLLIPTASAGLADRVSLVVDDYGPAAIHEGEHGPDLMWRVFFATEDLRDRAQVALRATLGDAGLDIAPVDVPDEDWAARSQANLEAVQVGRIVVAPPWKVPDTTGKPEDIVIVIPPSMGFGTGHHETTRLCLGLLQELDLRDRTVLDIGTGSGVLAIAAARLGAARVRGIDFDADAITAARESLARNPDVSRHVVFEVGDVRAVRPPADVVIANLTGGLLVQAAGEVLSGCRPGGALILSGFMQHEATAVLDAYARGATLVARRTDGEWEAAWLTADLRAPG